MWASLMVKLVNKFKGNELSLCFLPRMEFVSCKGEGCGEGQMSTEQALTGECINRQV